MPNDLAMLSAARLVDGYRDAKPSPVAAAEAEFPFAMPALDGLGAP